ncbi:MAG: aminomethyl-transferring glycine dehydrogenase [Bacteroidetes bacterium]|nr:aminomethyl-transferring glycine dehydrogenase [Bacteroidota bacterium]
MSIDLDSRDVFALRHNGPTPEEQSEMLRSIGVDSLDQLISETIPAGIRLPEALNLPEPVNEHRFLREFRDVARKNHIFRSFIGMGYYDTITPGVILRNIMENPGWYTAYTPYQAEIAQGRLEMLINFQTMVMDLTGMEIANASLLDEGTAAAEAMSMLFSVKKGAKRKASRFFVSDAVHPQSLEVLKTRALPIGIDLVIAPIDTLDVTDPELFGVLIQNPDTYGNVRDLTSLIAAAHENGVMVTVAADLLACTVLKSPGAMGADVVVGSSQRFGVPMGYGGPHAAFFATREEFKRSIPGRIIGVSVDDTGAPAYRMALQTREQHIRREKATSNICTAQVLLAVMAGAYAVYHGPKGLRQIGERVYGLTSVLAYELGKLGVEVQNPLWFDTLHLELKDAAVVDRIRREALQHEMNFRYIGATQIGISVDEAKYVSDIAAVIGVFARALGAESVPERDTVSAHTDAMAAFIEVKTSELREIQVKLAYPTDLMREVDYLTHPSFNRYHSEHEMLRYLKRLENKDLSLVHSMISLGSCTMKLNATAEMMPVTWPEFAALHPFVPADQALGYQEMNTDLSKWLCEITGFDAVSLQPNSGAQGEFAGLMTIRNYHLFRGDAHRNVAIIPSSAHGTNPASAVMAGMEVVVTKCDDQGNIDLADLREKAEKYSDRLAALMVTYPSTHGVFEEDIREICALIHQHGGQVYMDGANMNAQVGLTSPAAIGADVCHLNLHKTFCIPHGGGGPGMGPIGVAAHLTPFLPGHTLVDNGASADMTAISAAPFGSAGILPISYAYIRLMGGEGLTQATRVAILNANYIKARLEGHYDVLYTNQNGRSAHEMIIDLRPFKTSAGVEVTDIAKRLMDYGYHAPTVSFPVAGTMMIEPTESETKSELDRFCEAMMAIRAEIQEIADGVADREVNVLTKSPHTAAVVMAETWDRPYTRQKAAFPLEWVRESKFWPAVGRIDSAYGDRNLMCACIPIAEYADTQEEAPQA